MTTYNLDKTPDAFISGTFEKGSHVYRMWSIKGEANRNFIRDIDLRKDKLIIHGTEIKESIWEMLHNSLLLRSELGKLYVDCNGACYIYMNITEKSIFYRLIQNVIFDWSLFGVIVPNSVNDSLRQQQQQKEEELTAMSSLLSSAKGEASANKVGWETSKQEIERLTSQLSACRKEQLDKEMELQKVRSHLSVKEFEFEATKIKFEYSREEVKELQDQVSSSNKKDYKHMEMEVQILHHQLSSTISELNSTKVMWEFSKKENEDVNVKLQSVQDQVSSVVSELQSTKIELESSNKNNKELQSQLLFRRKENQDLVTELQSKIQNELLSGDIELQLTKGRVESFHQKIIELEEQLSTGEKVQDQLSLVMNELQSIKVLMDFTAEKEVESDDQCFYDECYVNKAIEIVDDQ